MENENNEEEVIIDSEENNEEIEVELDELAEDKVEDEIQEDKPAERPTETLEQKRSRLKRQLEQTEKKLGITSEKKTETKIDNLSTIDTIAIMKADIDTDDIPQVVEMAKLKGVSVAEALKSKSVQAILQEKKEERLTANATNVASTRRGSSRVSDDVLIERANKGIMPENDADLDRLIQAQLAKR